MLSSDPIIGSFEGTELIQPDSEKREVAINISDDGSTFQLDGFAGYSSGRSTAPDFTGQLLQKGKVYQFSFEDSFGNEGFALIKPMKGGIVFTVAIKSVKDARCLSLYESITLKKKKG